jgi:hypothetical protein
MKKIKNTLLIILVLVLALYLGGFLFGVMITLFKIMTGLVVIGLLIVGYYIGRSYKKR